MSRVTGNHQEREETKKDYFPRASEEVWPIQQLDFGFLAFRTVRQEVYVALSLPVCGSLLLAALGTNRGYQWRGVLWVPILTSGVVVVTCRTFIFL